MIRSHVSQRAQPPARTLADVPKLCDPYTPLDPVEDRILHADLSSIRGGDRLARIVRNVRRSGGIPTLHFLTGHLGSGKTTELLGVRHRLARREGDEPALHVLFVDADAMLDKADVELEDILIAIWRVVAEEATGAAVKVLESVWKDRLKEIVGKIVTDLPGVLREGLNTVLSFLRQAPSDDRKKLRSALGSLSRVLIDGLNDAFDVLRGRNSDAADAMEVAILIDNLEKLNPVDRRSVERLYLERLVALKELDAHLVITVPLYLCYSEAGASLIGLYGGEVVVLPMVKVQRPAAEGGGDFDAGIELLAGLLARRVDFAKLFEGDLDAAREIARRSGGCIRHALRIVTGAANECDVPPVSRAALDRATLIVQSDFERALPEKWVPFLRRVAEKNRFPDGLSEQDKRDMLRHLFVLEYQNGDPEPWYAVHPLVARCRKYQQAE